MLSKRKLLEESISHARGQLPRESLPQAEKFIRQYYEWAAPEDLDEHSPLDLYGAAVAHWKFASRRRPGETRVRVYNPRFEDDGWQCAHTVVEIVADDMPFLVDSVRMEVNRQGFSVHLILHPIMRVLRDEEGRLLEILGPAERREDAIPESIMHVEVDRHTSPEALESLRSGLSRVLSDVRAAVEDWPAMREKLREAAESLKRGEPPATPEEVEEARAFLEWLDADNFTFLGYREYGAKGEGIESSGLGILREGRDDHPYSLPAVEGGRPGLMTLTKASSRATVHRPSYMDYVGVRIFDGEGRVVGERRFLGLYTFSAYSASAMEIPIVRRKVREVLRRAGFPPASHNEKDLVEILETYPRDELFQISTEELFEISIGILHLQERQRVRMFARREEFGRFFSCLVFVPRDRYNTTTRQRMQDILKEAFGGTHVEYDVRLSESVLARLHFTVYTPPGGGIPEYDPQEIEERLAGAVRSWSDDLYDALVEKCGEEEGVELFRRYRDAFPPGYRAGFLARAAVGDIRSIEDLASEEDIGMSLYHPLEEPEDFLGFKLFKKGEQIPLSRVMPLLENMGVEVVDERPHRVEPAGEEQVWIHDFGLVHRSGEDLGAARTKRLFQECFARVLCGEAENDGFNRLVLLAGLSWREISVLRAYSRYLRQTGTTFSQRYMEDALVDNPHVARLLVSLFEHRFDPKGTAREEETARLQERIEEELEEVASLDEDRILRSFLHLILATVRTNYFQKDASGKERSYLSFKFDPSRVPDLPLPRPRFEIFVYSPRMEGVHLRGGEVARGGIRHSDRREDFRTEILGLMKAQMVKNAVIVPVGAKGGFVVKRPPEDGDRDAMRREAVECYSTLIRGMLDLTDNLSDGRVVPPPDVVRYDGDDTYLVVAADKGTATFSDIANEISREYGFWLGDAFASGGKTGYDHKEMGITAKGAWESVKRHFRELGKDIQKEDFTVVGIGDMSGDVFGNGMLQSEHIRLVGAFDHRHIFLDPDPDPKRSYAERKRLFEMPRSSWDDYDRSVISEGGGVFPRTAKSIPLSPEARRLLGVEEERLTPNEVISALLKAEVDLLFNGGIGTYVKASDETNAEVGDRSNDAVRVDARELRCRVVGEGGNLGFTQRGRIEYALAGGRIYMDAIDNSAGVDTSDHEVNIKILLDSVVEAGDMTEKQRNELLAGMTDEVARLVLLHNYRQTQAINNSLAQAASMADVHARYIRTLDASGKLDRRLEFLPDEEEIAERRSRGLGLTAPELAILLSYTKLTLYQEVLASDLPDDPYLTRELEEYFPSPLRENLRDQIRRHRLRREITATSLVNGMVNRCGTTFTYRLGDETGASPAEIARAYVAVREIFDTDRVWEEIEALDNVVGTGIQTRMFLDVRRLVERATRWLLRNRRTPDIGRTVDRFSGGVSELFERVPRLMPQEERDELEREVEELCGEGVPERLAWRVAVSNVMSSALDIVDVAAERGETVEDAASVYLTLGDRLRLHWLRRHIEVLPRDNRWRTLARAALRDDLYLQQAELTAAVLSDTRRDSPPEERVASWLEANRRPVERTLQVLRDINSSGTFDLSTLPVALREVRNLLTSSGTSGRAERGSVG